MDKLRGLYAITDPKLLGEDRLLSACEQALRGGARILQYRNKVSEARVKLHQAAALRELCTRYGATFLINDDPTLAATVNADGVHIGQSDGGIQRARDILGNHAIIGVTCHGDIALAQQMADQGASYVAFGRFFPSHTKPSARRADPAVLSTALPVAKVAIGGVTPDNAPLLVRAGADAVAVIHALFSSSDIEATARQFASVFPEE